MNTYRERVEAAVKAWPNRSNESPVTIATEADATEAQLRAALLKLRNEVGGLAAEEHGIRAVIGNTNWQALMTRVDEADAALAQQHKETGK